MDYKSVGCNKNHTKNKNVKKVIKISVRKIRNRLKPNPKEHSCGLKIINKWFHFLLLKVLYG